MAEESRSAPRELQLETRHLAAIVLFIVILCISAFMLGRWVERQAQRAWAQTPAAAAAAAGSVPLRGEDVNRELTYFRTLESGEKAPSVPAPAPETKQEPARLEPPRAAAPAPDPAPAASGAQGFLVQVMATKDRAAAEAMRSRLAAKGYRVSVAEGTGSADAGLRKVRVGPYPSRAEAEKAARRLKSEERVEPWIP